MKSNRRYQKLFVITVLLVVGLAVLRVKTNNKGVKDIHDHTTQVPKSSNTHSEHLIRLEQFFDETRCIDSEDTKQWAYEYAKEKEIVPVTCTKYNNVLDTGMSAYVLSGFGAGCGGCHFTYGIVAAETSSEIKIHSIDGWKATYVLDPKSGILEVTSTDLAEEEADYTQPRIVTKWKLEENGDISKLAD